MITVAGLTKTYGDRDIFKNVDVKLGNNSKIGLVGKNGCGKSTLIKILAGFEELTSGNIEYQNKNIGYIPQEFTFPDETVGEYLGKKLDHEWEFYRVKKLVADLKFTNFDPNQKLNTLSEGQKMKIKLIEVLLTDPTTPLIDEPTNHLDIEGILWFEEYISHLPKTVLMISHDRSFLNHVVDEIWEIDKFKIFRFVGDYDNYKTEKMKLIDTWNQEYVLFLRKKAQLEKLIENVRKIGAGKQRGKAVRAAKKRYEREVTSNTKEAYVSKKIKNIEFETDIRHGKLILRFENVSKSFGKNVVFKDLNFEMRGKEKIWLFGPNGAGKSTLVKLIVGEYAADSGKVTVGANIKIGYFSQTLSNVDSKKDLLNVFLESTGCQFGTAFKYLQKFLFDRDAIKKRVWQLSPGERTRFLFAIFAYKDYDLLILDEPDNHLDIETKEVLEKSLCDFDGTLILVSHDRYFVESMGVNKLLNLKDRVLREL